VEKLSELQQVETDLLKTFAGFVSQLKATKEGTGAQLLDNTMVLLVSNMRDGNSHKCYDAPAVLVGGGFRHGSHLSFHPDWLNELSPRTPTRKNTVHRPVMGVNQIPMCNLFLSLLQNAGIERDRFGSSNGTLTGLVSA
jgi:hypothetical protein